jgi:hypothetical protein
MHLHHQVAVDRLVQQHAASLALLHRDLEEALLESAIRWVDRFPNPQDVRGHARCSTIRQTLLHMDADRKPVPGTTLTTSEGQGMSVVLQHNGTRMRVRKYPTDHLGERLRVVQTPPPGQREAAAEAVQLALDEGLEKRLFPSPSGPFDLYVLWWPDAEHLGLGGAVLAAVSNIDSASLVQIWATAPLPRPANWSLGSPGTGAHHGPASPQNPQRPSGDFEEFDVPGEGVSGDEPEPA